MRKTLKKKLNLDKETVRALSKFALTDPNSCVAYCGI